MWRVKPINMRMNHIEDFFKTQTLVNFIGGDMGSFMINFLSNTDYNSLPDPLPKIRFSYGPSYEWNTMDYFLNMVCVNDNVKALFKNYYKDEFAGNFLYYYACNVHDFLSKYKKDRSVDFSSMISAFTEQLNNITEVPKNDRIVPLDELYFDHVKAHIFRFNSMLCEDGNNLPWKQKLFPYFPDNKIWLRDFLHVWKYSFYMVYHGTGYVNNTINSKYEFLLNAFYNKSIYFGRGYQLPDHMDLYDSIDMYKLIFMNDETELYTKIPNFIMTPYRQQLLNDARRQSLEIMDHLELNHLNEQLSFDDMASNGKIVHYTKEYAKLLMANNVSTERLELNDFMKDFAK
jgi:hypothetical protein